MKPLFLVTSPPPLLQGADAVFQDVAHLRERFGGETLNLYPLRRPTLWFPRAWYGWHLRDALHAAHADLLHVFFPLPYVFPVLRRLRRPLILTITAALDPNRRADARALRPLDALVVSSPRDVDLARSWGLERVRLIRPGIDTARFASVPPPPKGPFTLLVGSAPWTCAQFHSKGIEALLEVAASRTDLRLLFLWRGLWLEDLQRRIAALGIEERCEVFNEQVDVAHVLARCHAAAVLAAHSRLVRAFPHSLLEALAVGRPVLVSRCIPLADTVEAKACGAVVDLLTPASLIDALDRLLRHHHQMEAAAQEVGNGFDRKTFLDAHAALYQDVLERSRAGRSP